MDVKYGKICSLERVIGKHVREQVAALGRRSPRVAHAHVGHDGELPRACPWPEWDQPRRRNFYAKLDPERRGAESVCVLGPIRKWLEPPAPGLTLLVSSCAFDAGYLE